jgi:ABC-type transporter Mla subunit MlaD
MTLLFGFLTIGRLPSEQQRHNRLLRELKKIMATLNEVTSQLNQANTLLAAQSSQIADTKALIVKIGTETDRLKKQIEDLPPVGDAPQDLVDALEAIKTTIGNQGGLVTEAKEAAGVVDAKVDDAP